MEEARGDRVPAGELFDEGDVDPSTIGRFPRVNKASASQRGNIVRNRVLTLREEGFDADMLRVPADPEDVRNGFHKSTLAIRTGAVADLDRLVPDVTGQGTPELLLNVTAIYRIGLDDL